MRARSGQTVGAARAPCAATPAQFRWVYNVQYFYFRMHLRGAWIDTVQRLVAAMREARRQRRIPNV